MREGSFFHRLLQFLIHLIFNDANQTITYVSGALWIESGAIDIPG